MPAGISNSTVNPVALTPPRTEGQNTQRETSGDTADTQNAQAALAAGGSEVVRAPEPSTASQSADNEDTSTGTGSDEQASTSGAPAQQLQAGVGRGLGGNVDITA